jgi:hypothetical protein
MRCSRVLIDRRCSSREQGHQARNWLVRHTWVKAQLRNPPSVASLPDTAHEQPNTRFDFEFQVTLPTPEISHRPHAFEHGFKTDRASHEPYTSRSHHRQRWRLDYLSLPIASSMESFGETLGFGKGTSHGRVFTDFGDDPFEVYEEDTERTPPQLSILRDLSSVAHWCPALTLDSKSDDFAGEEIDILCNEQDN